MNPIYIDLLDLLHPAIVARGFEQTSMPPVFRNTASKRIYRMSQGGIQYRLNVMVIAEAGECFTMNFSMACRIETIAAVVDEEPRTIDEVWGATFFGGSMNPPRSDIPFFFAVEAPNDVEPTVEAMMKFFDQALWPHMLKYSDPSALYEYVSKLDPLCRRLGPTIGEEARQGVGAAYALGQTAQCAKLLRDAEEFLRLRKGDLNRDDLQRFLTFKQWFAPKYGF